MPFLLITYIQFSFCISPHLTAWNKAPLELIVAKLVRKCRTFYGTGSFITMFIRTHHRTLSSARWIQSTPSDPISLRSFLILSSHLRLSLPKWSHSFGFSGQNFVCISNFWYMFCHLIWFHMWSFRVETYCCPNFFGWYCGAIFPSSVEFGIRKRDWSNLEILNDAVSTAEVNF
jgi:hypothetical protein